MTEVADKQLPQKHYETNGSPRRRGLAAMWWPVTIKVSEITFSSTKWASHLNLEVAASCRYGIGTTELYMSKIYIKGLTN